MIVIAIVVVVVLVVAVAKVVVVTVVVVVAVVGSMARCEGEKLIVTHSSIQMAAVRSLLRVIESGGSVYGWWPLKM